MIRQQSNAIYSPTALRQSAKRREKNILAFADTIKKEQDFIDHFKDVVSRIHPTHPDVKKLKSVIKKKQENVTLFKQAIKDEKRLILEELKWADEGLDP